MLDIGCGTGEMLEFFRDKGYEVFGIEPSEMAGDIAINKDLNVFNTDFDSFFQANNNNFDVINLSNVLEHITYPDKVIKKCYHILNEKGILRIKVPNDFNPLQLIANDLHELNEWWVCVPDHVNYFDFNSLEKLLNKCDFSVVYKTTDFPMELFLLMGDNYVNDSLIGSQCHNKRLNFERALSEKLRKKIYDAFSDIGVGREVIMYAVKNKK